MILEMYEGREELVQKLKAKDPLGKILGATIAMVVGFVGLIIILQVYGISVVDLVVPVIGFLLPLTFIFGPALKTVFDSFLVAFVIQPWAKGDTVTTQGQTFTVDKMEFLTSSGWNATGLWIGVPNAPALSSPTQNYGRCAATRIRVYCRVQAPEPGKERFVLEQITKRMQQYCDERPAIFQKGGCSSWAENSAGGEFDDPRFMTFAINAGFLRFRTVDWVEVRMAKSEFIAELRDAVREVGAKGFCGKEVTVFLDASSVTTPTGVITL